MEISWEVMWVELYFKYVIVKMMIATVALCLCQTLFQPLTWREWNGPHLKYLVWWRRRDSREEWKNATTKWLRYYIYDADTFTPYDLKIQAVNDFGLGPESPVVTGYSGEDRKYLNISSFL